MVSECLLLANDRSLETGQIKFYQGLYTKHSNKVILDNFDSLYLSCFGFHNMTLQNLML